MIFPAELAESLRPYMTTGLPEYNVPPTEPMFIDKVALSLKRPPVNVKVDFEVSILSVFTYFISDPAEGTKLIRY